MSVRMDDAATAFSMSPSMPQPMASMPMAPGMPQALYPTAGYPPPGSVDTGYRPASGVPMTMAPPGASTSTAKPSEKKKSTWILLLIGLFILLAFIVLGLREYFSRNRQRAATHDLTTPHHDVTSPPPMPATTAAPSTAQEQYIQARLNASDVKALVESMANDLREKEGSLTSAQAESMARESLKAQMMASLKRHYGVPRDAVPAASPEQPQQLPQQLPQQPNATSTANVTASPVRVSTVHPQQPLQPAAARNVHPPHAATTTASPPPKRIGRLNLPKQAR